MKWLLVLLLIIFGSIAIYAHSFIKTIWINGDIQKDVPENTLQLEALDDDLVLEWYSVQSNNAISYGYILEHFDADTIWTSYPIARYTRLNGGDYTFIVYKKANGLVSDYFAYNIDVKSTLYERSWFWPSIIFYTLVIFSAIIYLVLLYNLREKLKVHDIRAKIARDLHDEIGANISGIGMSISLIQKKIAKYGSQALPDIIPDLNRVKLDINTTVEMLREEDWIIKPENDSLHKLLDKIKVFGQKILNACEITFEYDNSLLTDKEVIISMIQRRSAFLICKESINNIGKHSKAQKAWMKVSRVIEGIKIEIGDNGCGFNMEDEHTGNGVNNFRVRAAESLIAFDMKSTLGKGTVIIITIPELYTPNFGGRSDKSIFAFLRKFK